MPYYLGISNGAHDPAVSLMGPDGELLFAEALERSFQKKRAWDINPDHCEFLDMVIAEYGDPSAALVVATSWSSLPFTGKNGLQPESADGDSIDHGGGTLMPDREISPFLQPESEMHWLAFSQRRAFMDCGQQLKRLLWHKYGNSNVKIRQYDHHLAHAAMACFSSGFDDALCLVVDGEGEIGAVSTFQYESGRLQRLQRSWGPGSLGAFYSKITQLCDFDWRKGEEGKVMGLAAYGRHNDQFVSLMEEMLKTVGCRIVFPKAEQLKSLLGRLHSAMVAEKKVNPQVQADIAYAGQFVFEKAMEKLACSLYEKGGKDNIVLGGGCALNSSFNGKVLARTPFRAAHVACAPGDDGNAVGAAILAFLEDHPRNHVHPSWQTPYLGSGMGAGTIDRMVRFFPSDCISHHPGRIHREAAKSIAQGDIVGWVQGRAEFGPRALGNRSILADPRSFQMKDLINQKVKFRETFRPFAPAVMEEYVHDWFDDSISSPYMSFTAKWKTSSFERVPAVVHKDGTGRLQTVTRKSNEKYYDLISAFYDITGVPIVLNTSFNIMGKPIVHDAEDAVAVLYTTGLDCLCIGDYMIRKVGK